MNELWYESISTNGGPVFCPTIRPEGEVDCGKENGQNVSENEVGLTDNVTIQGLDLFGLKLVYYPVEHSESTSTEEGNLLYNGRDNFFGEDRLEEITRAFYFKGYMANIPPNVRVYKIQGIEGEDTLTIYAARTGFDYFSTYGGSERNTPETYGPRQPMIGDVIYLPNNDTFYEVRDVKYFDTAFGLASHTYTLTCKVYKDTKLTVIDNPTIPSTDPIYDVATSAYQSQYNTNDIFKLNDKLTDDALASKNDVKMFDYLWHEE